MDSATKTMLEDIDVITENIERMHDAFVVVKNRAEELEAEVERLKAASADQKSPIDVAIETGTCPVCGASVRVHTSDEGTSCIVPRPSRVEAEAVTLLNAVVVPEMTAAGFELMKSNLGLWLQSHGLLGEAALKEKYGEEVQG